MEKKVQLQTFHIQSDSCAYSTTTFISFKENGWKNYLKGAFQVGIFPPVVWDNGYHQGTEEPPGSTGVIDETVHIVADKEHEAERNLKRRGKVKTKMIIIVERRIYFLK